MSGTSSMLELLGQREIVVACGPGGVGKTTTAAAAAAQAALRLGGRVLVLTVDPARRLADALGIKEIGNEVTEVSPDAFATAAVAPAGQLFAAMLDTKKSWDDLIERHAPDPATAARIMANPLYQNITGRFIQSHDYIAMERLFELHSTGEWDLIVVDTPPTRNALDFLDAPSRMAEFFSSRLLRWLIAPARSGLFAVASKPFTQVADRILGTEFLGDITEFFVSLQSMYGGFVERANAVARLMADERTAFIVVSSSETVPLREAEYFVAELVKRQLSVGAVVLNKVLPDALADPDGLAAARGLAERANDISAEVAPVLGVDVNVLARVLGTIAESYGDFAVTARREAAARSRCEAGGAPVVAVPRLEEDIHDMAGLLSLGDLLVTEP